MKDRWTRGLDPEAKKDMEGSYKGATLLRRRVMEMLSEKSEETMRDAMAKANYNSPSWSHYQADKMGYIRALEEIKGFFED